RYLEKRGFSSLYGVTSLIGYNSGKVLDVLVKSSYCKLCESWKNKLGTAEYEEWKEEHIKTNECIANHTGASGNMEVSSVIEMFKRSIVKHGLRFVNYIGDGDSKTYSDLLKAQPYGEDFVINKKECVGHVQKRMGTRLRELVKKTTEEKVVKGKKTQKKTLSGKGKLTSKLIDKLTVYYGLAIRRNCESVEKMKDAIWATYYHYSSTDK
ncbi:GSCOCG00012780001-RA-CDS, partial [Cotesia congregata]